MRRFHLEPSRVWRRGESRHDTSGFNLPIADAEEFLASSAELLTELREQGATIELDFALMAGAEEAFTKSITFSSATLARFAAAGVNLIVSAYPVGER